ncbi:MAG: hypothetical protein ACE5E7_01015 [Anaerolineae bacterium]
MSNRESWKNGAIIVALLVGTSLVAAIWPVLTSWFGGAPAAPPEPQIITLVLPQVGEVSLTMLQALGVLAAVVAVVVVVAGLGLALLYTLLANQAAALEEDESFQVRRAALAKLDKKQLEALRNGRTIAGVPEHKMPRWSVISTGLIAVLFAVFFGMLVDSALVPQGEYMVGGRLVNSAVPIVVGFVAVTLLILAWWLRPQSLDAVEETDNGPIPWDFIWVLLTGLLVVGLGVGFMVYLNTPS